MGYGHQSGVEQKTRAFRRYWGPAAAVLAGLAAFAPAVPTAQAGAATPAPAIRVAKVRLGHTPRLPAGAAPVASLPAATPLRVDVVLEPRNAVALADYAQSVSTPGSTEYRHYLSERQFVSRFGPTAAAVESVRRDLVGAGLHPGKISANDLSIPVAATAAQLTSAFTTGFEQYRVSGGRTAFANTAAPQVAASIAPLVQTVVGLDDLALAQPGSRPRTVDGGRVDLGPQVATGGPQPCAAAVKDASADDAYTSDQVASAYDFSSVYGQGDLGAGQTVALYELQGYGSADIAAYQSCFGTSTPVSTVTVDGGTLAHAGVGEADVDIEQVLSLAPDTHIIVYEGPNGGTGGYDTYNTIVADDAASVVSTSWGLCEPFTGSATAEAEDTLFQEAATQGQTVVAAAGDEGSEDCLESGYANDTLAVDDPASQPYVTGAGGTMWSASGTPPVESAWNDGPTCCWGAGGGGVSEQWPMPSYQTGAASLGTINAGSSGAPCLAAAGSYCREMPDVSALAGPYPYLDYVSGAWGAWGGTSLAAPLWASLLALANASTACSGKDIGFANPVLYGAAEAKASAFNDVTTGNNDLTGKNGGTYPALTRYDMATGLGTPNAAALPALLCAGAQADQVTVTDPGNQSDNLASTVRLPIQASDSTEGQSLSYAATGLPAGLTINTTSGVISGSPTAIGTSVVLVKVKAGNGATGSAGFSWTVGVAFTSAAKATATVGKAFSFTVAVTGVPRLLKETPRLPKGLKFHNLGNGTATLAGTPNAKDVAGAYPLVLKATFGKGKTAVVITQNFALTLAG